MIIEPRAEKVNTIKLISPSNARIGAHLRRWNILRGFIHQIDINNTQWKYHDIHTVLSWILNDI